MNNIIEPCELPYCNCQYSSFTPISEAIKQSRRFSRITNCSFCYVKAIFDPEKQGMAYKESSLHYFSLM